jgi:hypothetical protein
MAAHQRDHHPVTVLQTFFQQQQLPPGSVSCAIATLCTDAAPEAPQSASRFVCTVRTPR